MLVVDPVLLPLPTETLFNNICDISHCMFCILSGIYITLLIVGNALGVAEITHQLTIEPKFAAKSNGYYCDSHTLRVCFEGSHDDMLALVRGNGCVNATTTTTSEAEATVSI